MFDDPDVPFGLCGPPAPPGPPGPPGLPPGWPPAPSLAGVRERVGTGSTSRDGCLSDLHHPSLNLFKFQ